MAAVEYTRESAAAHTEAMIAAFLGLSLDTAGRITDLNAGGVARTLLEAIATAFERLDLKVFLGLTRTIPTVLYESLGEGDGVATTVGFPPLPALYASGVVRFQRKDGITGAIDIPVGAELHVPSVGGSPEKVYATIVPAVLSSADTFVDTLAQATTAGTIGNTAANTMRLKSVAILQSSLAGIEVATNPQAFLNGAPAEVDEARRQRFLRYIRNLARSQEPGLEYGALRALVLSAGQVAERVLFARAIAVPDKRGIVDVFIDNGGAGASAALVQTAQTLIDGSYATDGSRIPGYKAAGIVARVKAVTPQIVDVACRIRLDLGFTLAAVRPAVVAAVQGYLFGLGVFADCILADLIATVVTVRGVADVTILTPAANVATATGARIAAGAVTVTEVPAA